MRHRSCRGFIILDAVMSIAILGITLLVLVVSLRQESVAMGRLSASRQAARLAESVLCELEAGLPLPLPEPDVQILIHPVEGGAQVSGSRWVRVSATVGGQTRDLIGLVPMAAARSEESR